MTCGAPLLVLISNNNCCSISSKLSEVWFTDDTTVLLKMLWCLRLLIIQTDDGLTFSVSVKTFIKFLLIELNLFLCLVSVFKHVLPSELSDHSRPTWFLQAGLVRVYQVNRSHNNLLYFCICSLNKSLHHLFIQFSVSVIPHLYLMVWARSTHFQVSTGSPFNCRTESPWRSPDWWAGPPANRVGTDQWNQTHQTIRCQSAATQSENVQITWLTPGQMFKSHLVFKASTRHSAASGAFIQSGEREVHINYSSHEPSLH